MSALLNQYRKLLSNSSSVEDTSKITSDLLLKHFVADLVVIKDIRLEREKELVFAANSSVPDAERKVFCTLDKGGVKLIEEELQQPFCISDTSRSRSDSELVSKLTQRGIRSFAAVPLYSESKVSGVIEIHFKNIYYRWFRNDLFLLEHIADLCAASLDRLSGSKINKELKSKNTSNEIDLITRSRRLDALYEISRSLQIYLDPALVTLRGLKALIKATASDCGIAAFYDTSESSLEIVAAEGVSESYVKDISDALNKKSLLKQAVESRAGFIISNIQEDWRAAVDTARKEGLKASIVMPLMFEDLVLGAIALFKRDSSEYARDDFDLVAAASSQICLIARQAEFYAAEKRNARSLAALYRLSHELSKHFSARDVAEHAFPIIQEEIPCKRMWLGVLNESGTHIVGQAGFGPGLRSKIINIQIELSLQHDFIDQALKDKRPVVVPKGEHMECSGLNMLVKRLDLGSLVVIPLVSLGQIIGLFIVEPESPSLFFTRSKLPLLSSMASELATVILARRFESKMADADKMRLAALLASGIAHNFNNLLQAIMGQASLIEMQLPKDSPLGRSAKTIVDSASRGAGLITQLLSCTVQDSAVGNKIKIGEVINQSLDLYRSIVGSSAKLSLSASKNLPKANVDHSRFQQVMTNILINAKEALADRSDGKVTIIAEEVLLASGEVDPELSPGRYIKIEVQDNGRGMSIANQARCFEPFFSTKVTETNSGSGGGLGLSSAYTIIRQFNGIITVKSELDKGAKFSIYIPVVADIKREEADPDLALQSINPDILALDLEGAVVNTAKLIAENLGYKIVAVKKRNKALEYIKQSGGKLKAFLVDVDCSDEDLIGFLRNVRELAPKLRIVISTFDHKKWRRLLGEAVLFEFIQKPLSVWSLEATLRQILSDKDTAGLNQEIVVERVGENAEGSKGNKISQNGEYEGVKYEN